MPTGAQTPIGFKRLQPNAIFSPDSLALFAGEESRHWRAIAISRSMSLSGVMNEVTRRTSVRRPSDGAHS